MFRILPFFGIVYMCHVILATIERSDYFPVIVLTNSLVFVLESQCIERYKNGIFSQYLEELFVSKC
jgi:hypothetical protein